ncbi:hypothetical protein [Aeromonas fluvialis]|uniref:hypothetical protein n=1 Tax=Aeromonas fluvialis TaxID=591962 RepID=UPI0005A5EBCD|nr:hypothetical protein [Aeromonas fluvialis]
MGPVVVVATRPASILEVTLWDNDIDHIMDNFSLRQNSGMKTLSNPDRRNTGGRWANDIALPADWLLALGQRPFCLDGCALTS